MKLPGRQRGVAAVEMGILLVALLVPMLGVMELGRAIYEYNMVVKLTRNAVRFLSTQGAGDPADVTTAKCLAAYGNRTCAGALLLPNLTLAMVSVCDSVSCPSNHLNQPTGSGVINLVGVTVTGYPITFMIPIMAPFQSPTANTNIQFGPITTTMRQVL